ncbi:Peroxiredoxin [Evansella caseinilytica]|uniref:Peroxiredoxin n=1 Tax=Evansella caseinilytica TaxID=1503961 RepID=A0A1H3L5B8_9BACI|nr:TlpA disulfide reductase family protein [Evansella caseinilytica]SDY59389.1 Peroxiredoxin [Evansella caseinilytica]
MNGKRIATLIIIITAIGAASYVLYENQLETNRQANEERLQEYFEIGGNDRKNAADSDEAYEMVDEEGVFPGELAKDFTLSVHGEDGVRSLSDFRGNYVVVNLWASWCPPCIKEMPDLIQFSEDYTEDTEIEVIGINMTTQEKSAEDVDQFIEDFQIPFLTLLDKDGDVGYDYQVMGIPITFVIDPDGRIIVRRQGYITYEMLESYYADARETYEEQ